MKKTVSLKDIDIIFFKGKNWKKFKWISKKKTYDYRNIIYFKEDISELDINIKEIPTIKKNLLVLIEQRMQERLII